jgi:hypothetical protein
LLGFHSLYSLHKFEFSILLKRPAAQKPTVDAVAENDLELELALNCLATVAQAAKKDVGIGQLNSRQNTNGLQGDIFKTASILRNNVLVDGVSMRCLFQQILSSITQLRVVLLASRILVSTGFQEAVEKGIKLTVEANSTVLSWKSVRCELTSDVRTGQFCLHCTGMKSVSGIVSDVVEILCVTYRVVVPVSASRAMDALQGELNNVSSDQVFGQFMTDITIEDEVISILASGIERHLIQNSTFLADIVARYHETSPRISVGIKGFSTLDWVLKHMYLASFVERITAAIGTEAASPKLTAAVASRAENIFPNAPTAGNDEVIIVGFTVPTKRARFQRSQYGTSFPQRFPHSLQFTHDVSAVATDRGDFAVYSPNCQIRSVLGSEYQFLVLALPLIGSSYELKGKLIQYGVESHQASGESELEVLGAMHVPDELLQAMNISGILRLPEHCYGDQTRTIGNGNGEAAVRSVLWTSQATAVTIENYGQSVVLTFLVDPALGASTLGVSKTLGQVQCLGPEVDCEQKGCLRVGTALLEFHSNLDGGLVSRLLKFQMNHALDDLTGAIMEPYYLCSQQLLSAQLNKMSVVSVEAAIKHIAAAVNDLAPFVSFLYLCYCNECTVASEMAATVANHAATNSSVVKKRGRESGKAHYKDSGALVPGALVAKPLHINSTTETVSIVFVMYSCASSHTPLALTMKGYFELTIIDRGCFAVFPTRSKHDVSMLNDCAVDISGLQLKNPVYYFKSVGTEAAWNETIDSITTATMSNLLKRIDLKLELSCSILT